MLLPIEIHFCGHITIHISQPLHTSGLITIDPTDFAIVTSNIFVYKIPGIQTFDNMQIHFRMQPESCGAFSGRDRVYFILRTFSAAG